MKARTCTTCTCLECREKNVIKYIAPCTAKPPLPYQDPNCLSKTKPGTPPVQGCTARSRAVRCMHVSTARSTAAR
eukprot:scaffold3439_cov67-Phaeocystis_antarctica.AAC.1